MAASHWRKRLDELVESDPQTGVGLHAVAVLTELVQASNATTMQELQDDLIRATESFKDGSSENLRSIALRSGCNIFRQSITRMSYSELEQDFSDIRSALSRRAGLFLNICKQARDKVAKAIFPFFRDNSVVLVHGFSRAVLHSVLHAASTKRIRLLITESRPDCDGYKFLGALEKAPDGKSIAAAAQLIHDTAVGSLLPTVDFVLMGAEVVTENGGVINNVGTYQIALLAKALNKPVYICAESLKFARVYPLDQCEVPQPADTEFHVVEKAENPPGHDRFFLRKSDYTPPEFLTQIYTDLGILTPSAISDELIKLYT